MNYYDTNPLRRSFLGHCSFGVKDMSVSKPFYVAALKPLGVSLVFEDRAGKVLGFGWGEREPLDEVPNLFERANTAPHGAGTHLAFNAHSRAAVDGFHAAALAHGGRDNGAPGLRAEIHDKYYACFVFDPDGYKLEAVFQDTDLSVPA